MQQNLGMNPNLTNVTQIIPQNRTYINNNTQSRNDNTMISNSSTGSENDNNSHLLLLNYLIMNFCCFCVLLFLRFSVFWFCDALCLTFWVAREAKLQKKKCIILHFRKPKTHVCKPRNAKITKTTKRN